jgi:hypothetical protein
MYFKGGKVSCQVRARARARELGSGAILRVPGTAKTVVMRVGGCLRCLRRVLARLRSFSLHPTPPNCVRRTRVSPLLSWNPKERASKTQPACQPVNTTTYILQRIPTPLGFPNENVLVPSKLPKKNLNLADCVSCSPCSACPESQNATASSIVPGSLKIRFERLRVSKQAFVTPKFAGTFLVAQL